MINGASFINAIISGANNISKNRTLVDKLNIFPVPDGDTGTNMSMTINASIEELKKLDSETSISKIASVLASQLLRGARGNSGVILSVLFKGFAKGFQELDQAEAKDIVEALILGVSQAYDTVINPTEGTVLTVARMASQRGKKALTTSNELVFIWEEICKGANEALDQTPELLPVLKRAGVVDAGGKGLCLIFEGMLSVFKNNVIIECSDSDENVEKTLFENIISQYDDNITFTYCTEFIVSKNKECEKNIDEFKEFLQSIGDSIVVVDDDEIIKIHVHTEHPGMALEKSLLYGNILTVKIENMKEQNKKIKKSINKKSDDLENLQPEEPTEEYGFVAVAVGDGIKNLFKDLGCRHVVGGGQTMNPSTENILNAIMATPAKNVYVFPNNKNIILAAEQTIELCTDRKVVVIPTKTIPQGISSILSFDSGSSFTENADNMAKSYKKVKTGQITTAYKNYEYGLLKVKEGEILALKEGIPTFKSKDSIKGVVKLANAMISKNDSFVTLIYGCEINIEQAEKAYELIQDKYGSKIEFNLVDGGQPIYHFILSVE